MKKKQLLSGNAFTGIAPNILLKHVENTAPFLFKGELDTTSKGCEFLGTLVAYKKNPKLLKNITLPDYFHMCLSAHWATAGTFVPTDVDNQIREGLWKHGSIQRFIEKMARTTIESWKWNYSQVTNRISYNSQNKQVMSTHEGTWLSVAIGAYCALVKNGKKELSSEMADVILEEIAVEEKILLQLREDRDHLNFIRSAPLMAHNFGDLDRVMDQWQMDGSDPFFKKVYKLGHRLNPDYSPILVYTGKINKKFCSKENHRHMALRQPKCLRRSHKFLVPVGPFMDDWGSILGASTALSLEEKSEIVLAFYEGFKRQEEAFGYIRAYRSLLSELDGGMSALEQTLPHDILFELKNSQFEELAQVSREEFEQYYVRELSEFTCPETGIKF
ncbi:MAG: hypothetical protein HN509_06360 [Halobacteriovoraceae bacterium]|jgi:hypothetical protein|nr:hypothetical protein [Halobacteriovoraceae bacterium]